MFLQAREKYGIQLGLERMQALLNRLGHPEKKLPFIHVAGTNGKGSVVHMIAQSLVANGYDVGVFTSPSFYGTRGYFLHNNRPVEPQTLLRQANFLFPHITALDQQKMYPSPFEILTTLALLIFQDEVDIAIIEAGMGGTYDSTNCIDPLLTIITSVAMDHQQFLGSTLAEISAHKAGIIKKTTPVITGNLPKVAYDVVKQISQKQNASLYTYTKQFWLTCAHEQLVFHTKDGGSIPFTLALKGKHQHENAAIALMALYELEKHYADPLDWNVVKKVLAEIRLPGRFEQITTRPPIIVDSAHNVAAIDMFIDTVKSDYKIDNPQVLFAGFSDKALQVMIQQLRNAGFTVTLTTFSHPRAATFAHYEKILGNELTSYTFVSDWQRELQRRLLDDSSTPLFVTGSLHFIITVRDFIRKFQKKTQ